MEDSPAMMQLKSKFEANTATASNHLHRLESLQNEVITNEVITNLLIYAVKMTQRFKNYVKIGYVYYVLTAFSHQLLRLR